MGEHAIDPVGRLTDVFEQQDHAAQVWQMGGAQQMGGDGQIAHQAGAFRLTHLPGRSHKRGEWLPKQQSPQALLAPCGLCRQAGEHRSVDASG